MDIQYTYSSTQNNGQITQSQDFVSGEQVNYQYDCLQRLISAATTSSQWGLSFSYDGFGNRLSEVATKGSAPTVYSTYDTATNRITGYTHDNNGNITHQPNGTWLTYDVENRVVTANANGTIDNYAYAPDGKRVYREAPNGTEYIFFYGAQGERIGPYYIGPYNYLMTTSSKPIVYFAGRRLGANEDRLGSQRRPLYPYGESENTPLSEDDVFFATYVRDGVTGLDYAVNRYYSSISGRFLSSDPYDGSARLLAPQTWNHYSYVSNDPINSRDPSGLCSINGEEYPDGYPPCPDITSVTVGIGPSVVGGGSGPNGRVWNPNWETLRDQQPYRMYNVGQPPYKLRQLYVLALNLRSAVRASHLEGSQPSYTNCQALVDFATAASEQNGPAAVEEAFGILTPSQLASNIALTFTTAHPVVLYAGGDNGFLSQYQNTIPDSASGNGDQAHHFAAFFQLGYSYGAQGGALAAYIFEYAEAIGGSVNQGDIALGIAAAQIGSDLKNGIITSWQVSNKISALCQP